MIMICFVGFIKRKNRRRHSICTTNKSLPVAYVISFSIHHCLKHTWASSHATLQIPAHFLWHPEKAFINHKMFTPVKL